MAVVGYKVVAGKKLKARSPKESFGSFGEAVGYGLGRWGFKYWNVPGGWKVKRG
jgi:hypothetical protein